MIIHNNSTGLKNTNSSSEETDKTLACDSTIEPLKKVVKNSYDDRKRVEGNKNKELYKMCSTWKCLLSGTVGAFIVLSVIALVLFVTPGFRYSLYYVNDDPSQLTQLLSCNLSENDRLNVTKAIEEENIRRQDVIEDLLDRGTIVSSEKFASSLSSYYNALIAVLAAVLVILNLFGFFAWRSNAAGALEQERRKLSDEIDNIDKRLEQNLEEILRKNLVVREKLESYIQRVVDSGERLSDTEWDKLHLLLEKYQKREVLMEIKADEEDNDGSIEE